MSDRVFKVIDTNDKERFFNLSIEVTFKKEQLIYVYEVHEILKAKHELKLISTLFYERKIYSDEYVFELNLQKNGIDYKHIEEIKEDEV